MDEAIINGLLSLFTGSEHKHGQTKLLGTTRTRDGKAEVECRTLDGAASMDLWSKHLAGELGLGIIPIRRGTNDCKFGAIDVDVYGSSLTLETINKRITDANLPVVVCRSKSGGAHIYLFTSEWVPASLLVEKLDMIAGFIGHANSEIFPAQTTLEGTANSDGNWINMPYYGGVDTLRYAVGRDNKAIPLSGFVEMARAHILSLKQLSEFKIESIENQETALFPDGPPCLECIFARARSGDTTIERNTALFNAGVYATIRWPGADNFSKREAFLAELNNLFPKPLSTTELAQTIGASDKKGKLAEYKFQCSRPPLKGHCNSSLCKSRTFGIGAYNGSVVRALAKVDTEPPIWILRIDERFIPLTTDELYQYSLLQKRVLEVTNILLPSCKANIWLDHLRSLLSEVHIIHTFKESTEVSVIVEKIFIFLYDRTANIDDNATIESISTGNVFADAKSVHFLPDSLYSYLKANGFDEKKRRFIDQVLVQYFQAKEERPNIKPRRRCFVVPLCYSREAPRVTTTLENDTNTSNRAIDG